MDLNPSVKVHNQPNDFLRTKVLTLLWSTQEGGWGGWMGHWGTSHLTTRRLLSLSCFQTPSPASPTYYFMLMKICSSFNPKHNISLNLTKLFLCLKLFNHSILSHSKIDFSTVTCCFGGNIINGNYNPNLKDVLSPLQHSSSFIPIKANLLVCLMGL